MSFRFVLLVSFLLIVLHQAGTVLLVSGLGRPREAILISGVVFLLYPLWRVARGSGRPAEVLRVRSAPFATYPIALAALLTAAPAAIAIADRILPVPGPLEGGFAEILLAERARDWVVTLLAAAVVPALGEELLYRGFLQRRLEMRFGPAAAITITALVFGLVHGFSRALPATILGLVLGWMAARAGSVLPGLVAHAVSNAIVVVTANTVAGPDESAWSDPPSWPLALVAAGAAALFLAWFAQVTSGAAATEDRAPPDEATPTDSA